jgi:hypothetical protein
LVAALHALVLPVNRIDLAKFWKTTEWGLFGDGDEAYFGASAGSHPVAGSRT